MISVLCPTRGRPSNMLRLAESIFSMASSKGEVELIFYIDEDDTVSKEKAEELVLRYPIKYMVGPRIVLSQMWNECYKLASTDSEIFHHCGDDVVFRTPQWNLRIEEEFEKVEDRILFVFGRDGIVDSPVLGTHGFVHKNWVDVIGYFVPPYFEYCYNDTWLTEVATSLGRVRYLPEILIEHLHPCIGYPSDATYAEGSAFGEVCLQRWKDKVGERKVDAEKLAAFIQSRRGS